MLSQTSVSKSTAIKATTALLDLRRGIAAHGLAAMHNEGVYTIMNIDPYLLSGFPASEREPFLQMLEQDMCGKHLAKTLRDIG